MTRDSVFKMKRPGETFWNYDLHCVICWRRLAWNDAFVFAFLKIWLIVFLPEDEILSNLQKKKETDAADLARISIDLVFIVCSVLLIFWSIPPFWFDYMTQETNLTSCKTQKKTQIWMHAKTISKQKWCRQWFHPHTNNFVADGCIDDRSLQNFRDGSS